MNFLATTSKVLASLSVATLVAACGGGGGSAPAPTVTPPATCACWDGSVLSGTVQPTKGGCPAVPSTGIKAAAVGAALSFTGIPLGAALTGSALIAQTGNSSITFTNGVGTGQVTFSTTYIFTGAKLVFSNAPDLTLAGNFTTGPDPVPFVWPTDVKNVVEAGIVNGVADQALAVRTWLVLGPASDTVGDANWNANRKNGNTTVVKTGEKAADTNGVQRPIWREIYKFTTGSYCIRPIFGDTGLAYSVQQTCFNEVIAYAVGVSDSVTPGNNGVIYRGTGVNANKCYVNAVTIGDKPVTCPF